MYANHIPFPLEFYLRLGTSSSLNPRLFANPPALTPRTYWARFEKIKGRVCFGDFHLCGMYWAISPPSLSSPSCHSPSLTHSSIACMVDEVLCAFIVRCVAQSRITLTLPTYIPTCNIHLQLLLTWIGLLIYFLFRYLFQYIIHNPR